MIKNRELALIPDSALVLAEPPAAAPTPRTSARHVTRPSTAPAPRGPGRPERSTR